MSDINYLEQLLPKVNKVGQGEPIDWQALLERDTGCPYDEQDYSPAQIRMSLKANPTEIDTTNNTERAERKRKFRSRGESRLTPPPTWLIYELIMEESHVGIYAPSQFLKSFTAIDLAGALATGIPALGSFAVARSGPVFYAAGEGKANVEKKRVTAWEVHSGLGPYGADHLYVGEGLIANDDETITADIGEIREILGGKPALAIVIDTLALALNGLDEDKSHVASRYFAFLNRLRHETGASVTISVGHFGKDVDRGERGSSAFQASYDTILWVRKHHFDNETNVHTIELWLRKQKDGEDNKLYYMQSKKVAIPDGESMVLVPITASEAQDIFSDKKPLSVEDVFCVLRELCRDDGRVTKRQLAEALARKRNVGTSAIEKALDKGKGQDNWKFKPFYHDGKWGLPFKSESYETLEEQLQACRVERSTLNGQNGAEH
jgi:hypothetical protein